MGMTITIKVEYEGKTPREDLGVQEKFSMDTIKYAKFDVVCATVYKLVDMINQAREEERNARNQTS